MQLPVSASILHVCSVAHTGRMHERSELSYHSQALQTTMETVKQAAAAVADSMPAIPGHTTSSEPVGQEPPVEQWLRADQVEVIQPAEEDKA